MVFHVILEYLNDVKFFSGNVRKCFIKITCALDPCFLVLEITADCVSALSSDIFLLTC